MSFVNKTIFLLDLCTGTGTHLLTQDWHKLQCAKWNKCTWLNVMNPTLVEWDVWQRALTMATLSDKFKCLAQPLGPWHTSSQGQDGWFITPDGENLFLVSNKQWFTRTTITSHQQTKAFQSASRPIPRRQHLDQYHLALVHITDHKIRVNRQAGFKDYHTSKTIWDMNSNSQTNHWTPKITAEG